MLSVVRVPGFVHSPFTALDNLMGLVNSGAAKSCCGSEAPAHAELPVDIRERENHYLIEASLPGFKKENVDVRVQDGVLNISATRETASESNDEGWIRRERTASSVCRQVRLPEGVTGDGIEAGLAEGVLTIRVPKPADVQPRKIAIN